MKFIEKFFKHELAIDLGTVNTLIYDPDRGILLNQPSVIAIDKYDDEVVAGLFHSPSTPSNQRWGAGSMLCQMCLVSRYSARPSRPSSRPKPDCL